MYWPRVGYIANCVFYGQIGSCIRVNDAAYAVVRGHNNIFMPAAAADFAVYGSAALGTVDYEGLTHSCIWTVADVAMTNHVSINSVTSDLVHDVIEANPLFADVSNYDFRPQNTRIFNCFPKKLIN